MTSPVVGEALPRGTTSPVVVFGKALPQGVVSPGGVSEELFPGTKDSLRPKLEPHTGGNSVDFSQAVELPDRVGRRCEVFGSLASQEMLSRHANLPVEVSGDRFSSSDRRETSSGVGDAENSSVVFFRTGNGRCEDRNAVLDPVDNCDDDIVSTERDNTREVEYRSRQQPSRRAKRPARYDDYYTQFTQSQGCRSEFDSANAAKNTVRAIRDVPKVRITHTRIFVNSRYKHAKFENSFTARSQNVQ